MIDATFIIRDGARRKATPCAVLRYRDDSGFEIEINQEVSSKQVPAFFVPFIEKGEYLIPHDLALRWIHERIPPPGRQNLGEVLKAHGLNEYNELAFLRSGRGESSQDDFIIEEINAEAEINGSVNFSIQQRKKLGLDIRARREGLGMSQRELADLVGIDQPALSKIESGKSNITFDLLSDIDRRISDAHQSVLHLSKQILWNKKRRRILTSLEEYAPDLSQTYKRLINELEMYGEKAESSIADSRIISHCFREIMDSFPVYIDDVSLSGMQGQEGNALKKLYGILNKQPLDSETNGVVVISSELSNALKELQDAHFAGSITNREKMEISVGGVDNKTAAPISAWKEAQALAVETAHLPRKGHKVIPSYKDYLRGLDTLENSIEVRIGNIYTAKQNLFDLIGKANRVDASGKYTFPRKDDVKSFISMLGDSDLQAIAFRELKNPLWLEALDEEGFFKIYAGLNESDFVLLHTGPFLSLCFDVEHEHVIKLLKDLSKTGWFPARGLLIELATKLSDEELKAVSSDFIKWAKQGYGIGSLFWDRCDIGVLVSRMLESADQDFQNLGTSLFQYLVMLRKSETQSYPYEKIETCISEYFYAHFIESIMPLLPLKKRMMISKNMLNQYVLPINNDKQLLPTRAIAYSLEDAELKEIEFHKKLLVPWIKEFKTAVLNLLKDNPEMVSYKLLEQRPLVKRCIMACLHEYIEQKDSKELNTSIQGMVTKLCFEEDLLFNHDYEVEIIPLLADFAQIGNKKDKERFLHSFMGWLDAWKSKQVSESSQDLSEHYEREADYLRFAILSGFPKDSLPGYLLEIREKYEIERGEYSGPRQMYKVTTSWGPNSPLDVEEFKKKGPKDSLQWLTEWKPTDHDRFDLIEYEGVSRVLSRLIEEYPTFFDGYSPELKELKLIYISGIIDGWTNAVKAQKAIPLECAIGLCGFVLSSQEAECFDITSGYDIDNGMAEAMRHVAWFLVETLAKLRVQFTNNLMHSILMLLIELRSRGLVLAELSDEQFCEDDPITASLNELSAISLSGILLWILRDESKKPNDIKIAFEKLDDALPDLNISKADTAAFALKMPGMLEEYRDWLEDRYERLFGGNNPSENQMLFLALQISYFPANLLLFNFLEPALEVSIQRGMKEYPATFEYLGLDSFAEALGYRMYQLIAVGKLDSKDEIVRCWNLAANPAEKGSALKAICSDVYSADDTTEEIAYRIQKIWDEQADEPTSNTGALQGAFELAASHMYSHDWLRKALLKESQSHSTSFEMTVFFDDIYILAYEDPEWGIVLLRNVIEHDKDRDVFSYSKISHALIGLYREKFGKDDNEDVLFCMNELGRMGILDLDLI